MRIISVIPVTTIQGFSKEGGLVVGRRSASLLAMSLSMPTVAVYKKVSLVVRVYLGIRRWL